MPPRRSRAFVEKGTVSGSARIGAAVARARTVVTAAPPGSGSWDRADADALRLAAGAAFFFSGRSGFSAFGVRVETAFFDLLGSELVADGDDGSDDGAGATAAGAGSGAGFGRCANPG